MSTKPVDERPPADAATAQPQPWLTDEDAHGWRVRYRGGGRRHEVKTTVVVELDAAQSSWIRREAQRTDLSYAALLKRFIDEARAAETPLSEPATVPPG